MSLTELRFVGVGGQFVENIDFTGCKVFNTLANQRP